MANATMIRFGYPGTLVAEYAHWCVLLRPAQATLGALVLTARSGAEAFSELPQEAFAELRTAVSDIERCLAAFRSYDRINYLMLMMVDPHVHFHVLPRYGESQSFEGVSFPDPGWPGPPDLAGAVTPDEPTAAALVAALKAAWTSR